jgi:hypothetical protein
MEGDHLVRELVLFRGAGSEVSDDGEANGLLNHRQRDCGARVLGEERRSDQGEKQVFPCH